LNVHRKIDIIQLPPRRQDANPDSYRDHEEFRGNNLHLCYFAPSCLRGKKNTFLSRFIFKIPEIMKKTTTSFLSALLFVFSGLFLLSFTVTGQETSNTYPVLPDNINAIVSVSCMPCHTSKGGILSKAKLNFTEWDQYSQNKQKEKAEKIYSELKKGAMPPKAARETRPEIIPTKEQVNTIKNWADSLPGDDK
jgi:hypothetical protein